MIRSSENQTNRIQSRTPLMTKCKLHYRSPKQNPKNKPITILDSRPCDWLVLSLLLPTPTIQFSLDRKRCSRKRNRKKLIRSDFSHSDSVKVMNPLTTAHFNFHHAISDLMTPCTIRTSTPSLVKTKLLYSTLYFLISTEDDRRFCLKVFQKPLFE